jgi:hypothetical protein
MVSECAASLVLLAAWGGDGEKVGEENDQRKNYFLVSPDFSGMMSPWT